MPYVDTIGPKVGQYIQSPGGGPWGSSSGGAVSDSLDVGRQRPPGTAYAVGFGRGDVLNTRKFQPDMIDRILIALNERPDNYDPALRSTAYSVGDLRTPTGATSTSHAYRCTTAGTTGASEPAWPTGSGATVTDGTAVWTEYQSGIVMSASETWARAAVEGLSQLESKALLVMSAYYEPITGYPNAPVATVAYIRVCREMNAASNELPIINDVDAANAVTFYRREIPKWRAMLTAQSIRLTTHWNACGGSGSDYDQVLLGYPGDDVIDEMGGDTYDSDDTGLYPYSFAPLWRRCTLSAATAVGVNSLQRNSYQVGPQAGDLVEIGTGTANAEQVVVSSAPSGTRTINFSTALTKAHAAGDFLTKVYSVGDIVTNYAMQYRSLAGNNATAPNPGPWTSTTQWAIYPFMRSDNVTPQPGVNCMTAAEQALATTAQHKAFRFKFFGEQADGSTTRYCVQFWYDFARTGIVPAGHSVDPRIPAPAGGKPFVIPEIGMFGLPSTNFKGSTGGGDDFIWAGDFLAWCAAMTLAHPEVPPPSWLWYNHNNGTEGAYTQVFATLPPWGVVPTTTGVIKQPYFPLTARRLLTGMWPAAQMKLLTVRPGTPTGPRPPATSPPTPPSAVDASGYGDSGYGDSGLGA